MHPTHHRQRIPPLISGLALLVLVGLAGALLAPPPADAKITNQAGGPVASVVDCIRSGESRGQPSDYSPRFVMACMGSAWDRSTYNFE